MKVYSSTNVKTFNGNCPAALGFAEAQTPFDRDFFNGGIAAHAVLEVIGEKGADTDETQAMVADAVVDELITVGRSYNDIPEPPMSPESAFAGRDLALTWLKWNELPAGASYEIGLGMTVDGAPCGYNDEACRYRGILDLTFTETVGDEDFAVEAGCVRDWKSAWPTNADELETIQRKGQAVLFWVHNPDTPAIKLEVTNLRTGMTYDKVIFLDDDGIELLTLWQKDILQACDAIDKTRQARPGAGCLDCYYTMCCDDCLGYAKTIAADNATALATLEAQRKELISILKPQCVDRKFHVEHGFVGYKSSVIRIATPKAHNLLVDQWYMSDTDEHSEEKSLLFAAELTPPAIEKIAKVLYPDKNDIARDELLENAITTKTESRFGVYKK